MTSTVAWRGQLHIVGKDGKPLEEYSISNGAHLQVQDGQAITPGTTLVKWDPHRIPILAEHGGKIRFEDIVEGETLRKERDASGAERWVIMEHKGDLHPQVIIVDERGQSLEVQYIPEKAHLGVRETQQVAAGTLLAHTPREVGGTQDITGGLPRVTEIFEARRPRDPAVMAEIEGRVRIGENRKGRRSVIVEELTDEGRRPASSANTWCRAASHCASTPATTSRPVIRWCSTRTPRCAYPATLEAMGMGHDVSESVVAANTGAE